MRYKSILRYLRGTLNWGLWYPKDSSIALQHLQIADSSWLSRLQECSTSSSNAFLGDRPLAGHQKEQKSAAISQNESEYIAMSVMLCSNSWMRSQAYRLWPGFNKIFNSLDDALVQGNTSLRLALQTTYLSTPFKPKEPTFQVALDVLTLTPFYPAFFITASVPAVYMQEFWTTVTYQKHHIRFKMNKKSYSFDMETFRNMLLICLKLPGQKFVDPPFEEEILTFIRELGYPGNIKLLSDVKVDTLPQPWRTFGTIINKCLSGKVIGIDTLHLSRAQILWGLYHQEKVDYVYLLWENLVFQIENKESRKNKYMFYPRFTKVIINHFMSQDQSIPRRNKVDWHMANDDPILTTMRFIPQHEVVQRYGAILPDYLTNPTMKESEAYKTYYDLATRKVQPKPKYVRRSSRTKIDEAHKPSSGKTVKATAKVAKSGKKKQQAPGLEALSDIALTEAEQMKLAIERSKTQLHISQPSGSGAHEGTVYTQGFPITLNMNLMISKSPWNQ
ncbi:hypothetical protein Tco_0480441 [Tanacetum coccineum]